ncbi:MAG: hypothetical protein AAF602_14635 [Myxococcota bacterium]
MIAWLLVLGQMAGHAEPNETTDSPNAKADLQVELVVQRDAILVDGEPVVRLEVADGVSRVRSSDLDGRVIVPLLKRLEQRKAAMRAQRPDLAKFDIFPGEIRIAARPEIRYHVIRDVMGTAGEAGFGSWRFDLLGSPRSE